MGEGVIVGSSDIREVNGQVGVTKQLTDNVIYDDGEIFINHKHFFKTALTPCLL